MIYAIKHGLFWDWVQWKLTGDSPGTHGHAEEIAETLERIHRYGVVRDFTDELGG